MAGQPEELSNPKLSYLPSGNFAEVLMVTEDDPAFASTTPFEPR
jgi:hypothetical protein